jgi:hypothetical protein
VRFWYSLRSFSSCSNVFAGSTPPDVSGTDGETTENVEDSIEEEDQAA